MLPGHISPLGVSTLGLLDYGGAYPIGVGGADFADLACLDFLYCFNVFALEAALGTGDDGELFLFALFGGGHEAADAGGVCGEGLFAEDVFACLDGGFKVHGAVAGRGAEHDDIDVACDYLLVGVKAGEVVFGVYLDAVVSFGEAVLIAQPGEVRFELVFKEIADDSKVDVGVCR